MDLLRKWFQVEERYMWAKNVLLKKKPYTILRAFVKSKVEIMKPSEIGNKGLFVVGVCSLTPNACCIDGITKMNGIKWWYR